MRSVSFRRNGRTFPGSRDIQSEVVLQDDAEFYFFSATPSARSADYSYSTRTGSNSFCTARDRVIIYYQYMIYK